MAIGSNDSILKFGTADPLDDTSGSVASAAFSVAGDLLTWTNDDDAPLAHFLLRCTFATAPAANRRVVLYAQMLDMTASNYDAPVVGSDDYIGIPLVGFQPQTVNTAQNLPSTIVELPVQETSQIYQFFLKNDTDQTISAGWDLIVTPVAHGPHS